MLFLDSTNENHRKTISGCIFLKSFRTKMFTIVLLVVHVTIQQARSCGVSTHISIANQALQSFADDDHFNVSYRNIILENPDAFYAGSNYPDAMYNCFGGRYHGVSEDTHWTPFLNATVVYIRRTFPKPWNEATRKLIAFTFGIVSHQVADITWHSLGIDQGFLQTMSKINFHNSFSTAHPLGDIGGDMVSMFEGDLQNVWSSDKWYVPVNDLVKIYQLLYGKEKISGDVILPCSLLLFAEWIGETSAGADLYSIFANKSPFLAEELHRYYLGGKSDMAAWSSLIWHETTRMIENGPETCDIPRSTLHLRCSPTSISESRSRNSDKMLNSSPKISLVYFRKINLSDITTKRTSRGIFLGIKGRTVDAVRKARMRLRSLRGEPPKAQDKESFVFISENKYAELGWSLISDKLPSLNQVLITGAPWYGIPGNSQHGRVYILLANRDYPHHSNIDQIADQILDGEVENGRFGFAVAVLDYNADGLNDLAISAPSEGSNDLNYTGKVYIYYGDSIEGGVRTKPDVIISGDQRYFNLGTHLVSADVNMDGFKDLIIGSRFSPMGGEQRGSVAVFFSGKKKHGVKPLHYFASQADWLLKGEQNYSWFGYNVAFHGKTSVGPVLLVSAPAFRVCAYTNCSYSTDDVQSVGKLYAYRWVDNGTYKQLFEMTGKASLGMLGVNLAIGDPFGSGENDILAVSSPSTDVKGLLSLDVSTTFYQAGQVYLLSLQMLARKRKIVLQETDCVTLFEGDRDFGRFGWYLSWQDVNADGVSDLVVGSPYRTENILQIGTAEEGAVYVFYGGASFPRGNVTRNCGLLDIQPCPEKTASLYFKSSQKFSQFGRNVVAVSNFGEAPSLIVSSPRQTGASLHSGALTVFALSSEDIHHRSNVVK